MCCFSIKILKKRPDNPGLIIQKEKHLRKLFFIGVLLLFYSYIFSYVSKFLVIDTNSLEYQMILNPDSFSLKKGALIAAGVKEEFLENYLVQISNFEAEMAAESPPAKSNIEQARYIFTQMHKKILKNYHEPDTTLDVLLREGSFNCLSSTLLYNSLLEDQGIAYKAVVLPTHAYTMLLIEGREIDVENTSPFGFDIGTNEEAQENFKKLTGFSYSRDPEIMELVDKKGLLAYTYANIAYFASKTGQVYSAFQNALKSWAIYPDGKYVYTNVAAAYSLYVLYLADSKKDFTQSLSILEEAISHLPQKSLFLTNYFYVLDKYLNSLVDSSLYDKAFEELDRSREIAGTNDSIENNLYTRVLYRMINKEGDFRKAYEFGKKALAEKPQYQNITSLMINGLNLLSKKLINDWQTYPEGEDFILEWYQLMKNDYFDELLENYYNQLGLKFYDYGNPDKGIEIIWKGLSFFPQSRLLKNNMIYITGNTANAFFKKEEYEEGIKYTKIGLQADPKSETLLSNLLTVYRLLCSKEIEKKNYRKAQDVVREALKSFPKDNKLNYYKDYIKKKLK